jgi:CheY-like chemotaxis protein
VAEENSKRILIVDDEPSICRILTDLLMVDGHYVWIASSPGDAIEHCRMRHFDLVFMDFHLPEMSGDKLLSILKRNSPRQRIVLMSGQKPFPKLGHAEFLVRKPFTAETIREVITKYAA